ncbi:hypothetical protein [Sinomonas soli]
MNRHRPAVIATRPADRTRVDTESMTACVRPAKIASDGQLPAADGVAFLVSGSARIILDLPGAYRLASELADVIDRILGSEQSAALRRLESDDPVGPSDEDAEP